MEIFDKTLTVEELKYIKAIQREFKEKFGKELIVDFNAMKGIGPEPQTFVLRKDLIVGMDKDEIEMLLDEHNLTIQEVRAWNKKRDANKREFMIELSKIIFTKNWDLNEVADYLAKDRTTFYYYADVIGYKFRRKIAKAHVYRKVRKDKEKKTTS